MTDHFGHAPQEPAAVGCHSIRWATSNGVGCPSSATIVLTVAHRSAWWAFRRRASTSTPVNASPWPGRTTAGSRATNRGSDERYSSRLCRWPVPVVRRFQAGQGDDAGQEVVAAHEELRLVAPQRQVPGGVARGDVGREHAASGVDEVAVVDRDEVTPSAHSTTPPDAMRRPLP